ncbi:MAG: DUF962 domain-containing protein [Gammaproteobacteria bacterium]|nr:DUF962 domain-containing protein [Gammaproteobacteria bacterium]
MSKRFKSFGEFYPYYLSEHSDRTCRRLHFVGTSMVIGLLAYAVFSQTWFVLFYAPLIAYGLAWIGHFFFEKNRPATFSYPVYSLMGDWVMYKDMLIGRVKF